MKALLRFSLYLPFLILSACSDDPEPAADCRLNTKTDWYQDGNPVFTTTYNYSPSGVLTSLTTDSAGVPLATKQLEYDNKGRLAAVERRSMRFEYTYDDKGRLYQQDILWRKYAGWEFTHLSFYRFWYDAESRLTEVTQHGTGWEEGDEVGFVFQYQYTNGEPTNIIGKQGDGQVLLDASIAYDAYQKPKPDLLLDGFDGELDLPSQHNIIRYGNPGWKPEYNYTIAYTYNEKGYPVSAIKTLENGQVYKANFTYSCD